MSAEARFTTSLHDDVVVIVLEGEIDLSNGERIGGEILSAVPAEVLGLVLDVGGLRYLDSTGISALFSLARALYARRQTIVLVLPEGAAIDRLFHITRIPLAIPVERTGDAAIAAIRAKVDEPTL